MAGRSTPAERQPATTADRGVLAWAQRYSLPLADLAGPHATYSAPDTLTMRLDVLLVLVSRRERQGMGRFAPGVSLRRGRLACGGVRRRECPMPPTR